MLSASKYPGPVPAIHARLLETFWGYTLFFGHRPNAQTLHVVSCVNGSENELSHKARDGGNVYLVNLDSGLPSIRPDQRNRGWVEVANVRTRFLQCSIRYSAVSDNFEDWPQVAMVENFRLSNV